MIVLGCFCFSYINMYIFFGPHVSGYQGSNRSPSAPGDHFGVPKQAAASASKWGLQVTIRVPDTHMYVYIYIFTIYIYMSIYIYIYVYIYTIYIYTYIDICHIYHRYTLICVQPILFILPDDFWSKPKLPVGLVCLPAWMGDFYE